MPASDSTVPALIARSAMRLISAFQAAGSVLASFGLAWVFETFFDGNHNDLIEAGVIVVAAAGDAGERQHGAGAHRPLGHAVDLGLPGRRVLAQEELHALARTVGGFDASLLGGLVVAALALAAMFVAMQWLRQEGDAGERQHGAGAHRPLGHAVDLGLPGRRVLASASPGCSRPSSTATTTT
jgi:hypothetical protein